MTLVVLAYLGYGTLLYALALRADIPAKRWWFVPAGWVVYALGWPVVVALRRARKR